MTFLLANWKWLAGGIAAAVILFFTYNLGADHVQAKWDKSKLAQSQEITQSIVRQSEGIANLTRERAHEETTRAERENHILGEIEKDATANPAPVDCRPSIASLQRRNELIQARSNQSAK